jgi:hypothetical protein
MANTKRAREMWMHSLNPSPLNEACKISQHYWCQPKLGICITIMVIYTPMVVLGHGKIEIRCRDRLIVRVMQLDGRSSDDRI